MDGDTSAWTKYHRQAHTHRHAHYLHHSIKVSDTKLQTTMVTRTTSLPLRIRSKLPTIMVNLFLLNLLIPAHPYPCNDLMHVTTCWIAVYRMPAGIQEWRTRHASHTPSRALPLPFKLRSEVPTIQVDLSYNLRCQGQQTFEAGERICATHCLQALLCRMRAQASPATPQPPAMRESSAPSF